MSSPAFTRVEVVRTHLELHRRGQLRPAKEPHVASRLERQRPISVALYRELYSMVGERWHWRDRQLWSDAELERYLASPDIHLWTLHVGKDTAGYFELQRHADGRVEIMYFGLAPAFIGQGLGGWMLTRAVKEAFALSASKVMLNTCTLDAASALPNYVARGFIIVREEKYTLELPVVAL
jgi:GNAT superfamily N-acetyltransferase